jgi:hypothetical protein
VARPVPTAAAAVVVAPAAMVHVATVFAPTVSAARSTVGAAQPAPTAAAVRRRRLPHPRAAVVVVARCLPGLALDIKPFLRPSARMSELIQFPNVALSLHLGRRVFILKVEVTTVPTYRLGAARRIQGTPVLRRPIGPSLTLSLASLFGYMMTKLLISRWTIILMMMVIAMGLPMAAAGTDNDSTTNNTAATTTTAAAVAPILCPFFKTVRPNPAKSVKFLWDVVVRGNMELVLAKTLVFGAVVQQQGFFPALFGAVLDIHRLDQIPGVSHRDLYNSQYSGVAERLLERADTDGYISLQDLVEVKKWVAEVNLVKDIGVFSRGETVFVFLGAGGNLDSNKVLAMDALRFLQSDWEVDDIGSVNAINLAQGLFKAGF